MFTFAKIKAWWTARREAKRAWWAAEIIAHLRTADTLRAQHFEHEIDALRKDILQHVHDVEGHIFDKLKEHRHQMDEADSAIDAINCRLAKTHDSIAEHFAKVNDTLTGIRSRYQWLEERYDNAVKTGTPRLLDYDNRQ